MKKFLFILFALLSIDAWGVQTVYFEDRYGKEVAVEYHGNKFNPSTIVFHSNCGSEPCRSETFQYDRFKDLVSSILSKTTYSYELVLNDCAPNDPWCDELRGADKPLEDYATYITDDNVNQRPQGTLKKVLGDFFTGLVNGVGNNVGSRSVDAIAKGIAEGKGTNTQVLVVTTESGRPVSVIKFTGDNEAIWLPHVSFNDNDIGGITTNIIGNDIDYESIAIMHAARAFMQTINGAWKCKVASTNSGGGPVTQIVCGYWP